MTDADVVLGYLDPDNFLGGRMKLDRAKSVAAVQTVADALGLGLMEAAAGIAKIAEFKMADIIRKMTVEKGYDPRDFVLFAFGGAGPVHAGVFGAELGVQKVIVPLREIASTWCAFGAASADILHDMRHRGQINEVECVLAAPRLKAGRLQALHDRFYARYEQLYGANASFRDARLEIVTLRLRASAATPRPRLHQAKQLSSTIPDVASMGRRDVYWDGLKRTVSTPIFAGAELLAGNEIDGPCVVETAQTNVVVHPGRRLRVDAYGNFEISFETLTEKASA